MNSTLSSDFGNNVTVDENNDFNITCHAWLRDKFSIFDNVTLEEVNHQLVKRNLAGICLLCILSVIGLIGNTHVLWIYLKQFKKSNYRVYVLWLAILDIFNCVVVAPMIVSYLFFPVQYPSNEYCKLFRFILYTGAIASTSSLVAIAIDRYKKICSPLGKQLTSTHAKLLCLLSLAVAVFLSWPAPILYGLSHIETGIPGLEGFRCFTEDGFKRSSFQIIFNAFLGIYFFAVSATMVFVYIKIGRHIKKHFKFQKNIRRMSAMTEEEANMATGSGARKSTYTLCAVTIAYICSAIPHHLLAALIFVVKGFDCSLSLVGAQIYYAFIWSYFVNSVVNPFIYGIRDRKFRSAVKGIYKR